MSYEDDSALRSILALANERGKFAIQMSAGMCEAHQKAFETGLEEDLYRLIDVAPIAEAPGVFRIFILTEKGHYRLAKLEGRAN